MPGNAAAAVALMTIMRLMVLLQQCCYW